MAGGADHVAEHDPLHDGLIPLMQAFGAEPVPDRIVELAQALQRALRHRRADDRADGPV